MSENEGGKQGGVIAGLFGAVGLAVLRLSDNCAAVGARSMSAADNIAVGGSRAAGGVDDVARLGSRAPLVSTSDEALGLEHLGEVVGEVGLELVSYEFDSDAEVPERFIEVVERPMFVDLTVDGWVWTRLAENGNGADQAPWIFVSLARGESMHWGDETVPVRELAATCWQLGTTCVFVGCATDCAGETKQAFSSVSPTRGMRVESYVTRFLSSRLAMSAPTWVAVAGGGPERRFELFRSAEK